MISTHILDTSLGMPAKNVTVVLEIEKSGKWTALTKAKTNADGRIVFDVEKKKGNYRLTFDIENYFHKKINRNHFF